MAPKIVTQRRLQILGVLLLLGFAGFTMASFRQTLTPYVSYDQARTLNRTVQVAGGLEAGSTDYDDGQEAFFFTLNEPEGGQSLRVRYHGLKPANFEDAVSIVAIGRFDPKEELLVAEKLLVKCPSKYQGAEVETKVYE
jgi:cytochrome c-type biogenesis protein CcmE